MKPDPLDAAIAILRDLEWSAMLTAATSRPGEMPMLVQACPVCFGVSPTHKPGCKLLAVIESDAL